MMARCTSNHGKQVKVGQLDAGVTKEVPLIRVAVIEGGSNLYSGLVHTSYLRNF